MSAWLVDKAHIDLLVAAFFKYEITPVQPITPDALGAILWKENRRSINYRYNERRRTPRYTHETQRQAVGGHPYRVLGPIHELVRQPMLVFKQLMCFHYQTCEHPEYGLSTAYGYVTALKFAILKTLNMTEDEAHEAPEWDTAPWGIDY